MAKDIFETINEYLVFIEDVKGLAPSTIETKRHHLEIFGELFKERDPLGLNVKDTHHFLSYLKNKDRGFHSRYHHLGDGKLSLMTIQHYMASVRQFIRWTNSMGYTSFVSPDLIVSPRVSRIKINPLSDYELASILNAPEKVESRNDIKTRNLLLIQVGYYLGLRISEALNLKFSDLLHRSRIVTIL